MICAKLLHLSINGLIRHASHTWAIAQDGLMTVNSGADCGSAAEALAHGGTTGPGEMVRP
jgi:hypothetical protein